MPRKKQKYDMSELEKLPVLREQLSLKELLYRVTKEPVLNDTYSLEKKIIILKILALNNMSYVITSRQVGVSKRSLHAWWNTYGELIQTIEPERAIAKEIATDIAIIQGASMKKAYNVINKSLDKLDKLVGNATGTRSIYAVAEAIRATTEVIKIDKELNDPGKTKGTDFFMNIHNMMIQNQYGNTD